MARFVKMKMFAVATALTLGAAVPAVAQEFDDPSYGPRQRYADELAQPYEFDGFEVGREGPIVTTEQLGIRPPGNGRSFEWEAPPIGSSLPVIPGE